MLEKTCNDCGCPLFEVKGKTFCVVCAENEPRNNTENTKGAQQEAVSTAQAVPATPVHDERGTGTCGEYGGKLADELALTILSVCGRIQNEKDPENVLTLMNSVKTGCEALGILYRL